MLSQVTQSKPVWLAHHTLHHYTIVVQIGECAIHLIITHHTKLSNTQHSDKENITLTSAVSVPDEVPSSEPVGTHHPLTLGELCVERGYWNPSKYTAQPMYRGSTITTSTVKQLCHTSRQLKSNLCKVREGGSEHSADNLPFLKGTPRPCSHLESPMFL